MNSALGLVLKKISIYGKKCLAHTFYVWVNTWKKKAPSTSSVREKKVYYEWNGTQVWRRNSTDRLALAIYYCKKQRRFLKGTTWKEHIWSGDGRFVVSYIALRRTGRWMKKIMKMQQLFSKSPRWDCTF